MATVRETPAEPRIRTTAQLMKRIFIEANLSVAVNSPEFQKLSQNPTVITCVILDCSIAKEQHKINHIPNQFSGAVESAINSIPKDPKIDPRANLIDGFSKRLNELKKEEINCESKRTGLTEEYSKLEEAHQKQIATIIKRIQNAMSSGSNILDVTYSQDILGTLKTRETALKQLRNQIDKMQEDERTVQARLRQLLTDVQGKPLLGTRGPTSTALDKR